MKQKSIPKNNFLSSNHYNKKSKNAKFSKPRVSLILIGATGDGKSQLGNFILNKNLFKVSEDPESETKETTGYYGYEDSEDVFVIDTPGLQDSEGKENIYLNQMRDYVRKLNSLNAIIIVLNFNADRFSEYIQHTIKVFVNMFPIPNFWDHVSFVFTHYYVDMIYKNQKKKPEKIRKFTELIIQLMIDFKKINNNIQIPSRNNFRFYFVDTDTETQDKDINSIEEVNRMIGWASSLETFETDKINKVDNKVVNYRYEYQTRKVNSTWKNNIETEHYVKEKRKIEILYCGKESFLQWEKVNEFTKEIIHKPEIIRKDKKTKSEKSSSWYKNIETITTTYYYKYIYVYNDNHTEESKWFYDKQNSEKIRHPKQLINTITEYKQEKDSWTNKADTLTIYYTYYYKRMKKVYNDDSVDYTFWEKYNTTEKRVTKPPHIIYENDETKTETYSTYIKERKSKRVFDYWFIVSFYKTVYYTEVVGKKITETYYRRTVSTYSDDSVVYGDWYYDGSYTYNEYF